MSDFRDVHNGVNDPVEGADVKGRFTNNQTPHERAQQGADIRAPVSPAAREQFLPEALRRARTDQQANRSQPK
jgi:hypothetical protein